MKCSFIQRQVQARHLSEQNQSVPTIPPKVSAVDQHPTLYIASPKIKNIYEVHLTVVRKQLNKT